MNDQKTAQATLALTTQGDTGSASRVTISLKQQGNAFDEQSGCRIRICDSGVFTDATNATIAGVTGQSILGETHTATKDLTLYSATAVAATGVLTFAGVVVEGETLTVGSTSYKFGAGGLSTADLVGFTEIDISATAGASQGTLTIAEPITALDAMEIAGTTYTFVANGTANSAGEISLGADEAASKVNIVAAINGTDGVNSAHPLVTAATFATDDCVITAISGGVAGDAITTTESFTHVSNVFDAATLGTTTAGNDTTASEAVTAVAATLTGDVTGTDGAGDTVDCVATTAGTAGNSLPTTETCANGSFAAALLSGGLDDQAGTIVLDVTDGTAESVTLRIGQAEVGGWGGDYHESLTITHAAP